MMLTKGYKDETIGELPYGPKNITVAKHETTIMTTSAMLSDLKCVKNEDSKNGFSFAIRRQEAKKIDILRFCITFSVFLSDDFGDNGLDG